MFCTQMHETLDALNRLQILFDPEVVARYRLMLCEVATLRVLVNSSELWLSLRGPTFLCQALLVLSILDKISLMCVSGGYGSGGEGPAGASADMIDISISRGRASTIAGSEVAMPFVAPPLPELLLSSHASHMESQQLLRNMGTGEILIELLKLNITSGSGEAVVTDVLRRCHVAVQTFCRSNVRNQALMEAAVEHIISHLPLNVSAEETLVAVYSGNRVLCEACPEGVVRACVNMVERRQEKRYLMPLHGLVICRGVPIKRNQLLVLKCLLEASPRTLLTYTDPRGIEERAALLREYQSSGAAAPTGALAYHIDLIELLAEAADGKIGVAEAKCQALIPLADAVAQVEALTLPEAKAAFVNFINFVFFDAENPLSEGADADQGWRLMDQFCKLFRDVVRDAGAAPSWAPCVYHSCLPAIVQFMTTPVSVVTLAGSHSAAIVELAKHAGNLFSSAQDEESRNAAAMCMRALDRRVKTLDVQVPQHAEAVAWSGGKAAPVPVALPLSRSDSLCAVEHDDATIKSRYARALRQLVHDLRADERVIHLAETEFEVIGGFYVHIQDVTTLQYGAERAVTFSSMIGALAELLGGAKVRSSALSTKLAMLALKACLCSSCTCAMRCGYTCALGCRYCESL